MRLLRLATDIEEDDKAFTIKADIPGMSKEDVKIKVLDNTLTISGERKEERQEGVTKEGKAARVERSYGSFVRSFSLPRNVDAGGIKASTKDGVLTVVIPKVEEPKPEAQEIAIE
ncbi:HSP20-like chaperone [Scenedesmus sp. NREL 46B-D3]|nr:HSP20-like chaperone [Scenedesmus sp. NREL 46B-D3]